jgi:hypothetical protein
MTDDLNPKHDEPAEGPRDAGFSSEGGAETVNDAAGDASRDTAAKANEVIDQIRDAVEDFAEKAAPAVKEFSAKAAELVAVAADRAAPLVQRAGEVTADASGKLAEKSRTWAHDIREQLDGNGAAGANDAPKDATGAAKDAAEGNPPL